MDTSDSTEKNFVSKFMNWADLTAAHPSAITLKQIDQALVKTCSETATNQQSLHDYNTVT